jgi:hypothetical protein
MATALECTAATPWSSRARTDLNAMLLCLPEAEVSGQQVAPVQPAVIGVPTSTRRLRLLIFSFTCNLGEDLVAFLGYCGFKL